MKNIYKKKLEKAALLLREVFDDFETEGGADFEDYGTRLDDLAGEIEDILAEDEDRKNSGGDDDEEDAEEAEHMRCFERQAR